MRALVEAVHRTSPTLAWSLQCSLQPASIRPARWQVLQSVAEAQEPRTVPYIARNLALSRQAVQRVVNEIAAQGLVALGENPHHARAKVLRLTAKGRERYEEGRRIYDGWLSSIATQLGPEDIAAGIAILDKVAGAALEIVRSELSGAIAP
jgi:DNA-binding MarR family transcriptional regulator